jgi:hypothetical protein
MSRTTRLALAVAATIAAAALAVSVGAAALLGFGLLAGMLIEHRRLGLALPGRAEVIAGIGRTVGWPAAAAAVALVAASGLLLIGLDGSATREPVGRARGGHAAAGPPPRLRIRVERADRSFRVPGASYRVTLERSAAWAREIRRRSAGPGWHWVTVAVHARALDRRGFDPTRLPYRLASTRGVGYVGTFRGGTGPRSLATRGALRAGQGALVQLGFRVRDHARRLQLVFEDPHATDAQLRVQLT